MAQQPLTFREKIERWEDLADLQDHITRDDLLNLVNDRDFLRDVLLELKSKVRPDAEKALYLGKVLDRSRQISGD